MNSRQRALIIIGGHERDGDRETLREIAERVGEGKLVIAPLASSRQEELYEEYVRIFRRLGVRHIHKLAVGSRQEAEKQSVVDTLKDASGVFFTGGDQLRITSLIGDTPVYTSILEIYRNGGFVAGTSAGASVMPTTMLAAGGSETSHKIGDTLRMAPGLGLIDGVIIDQHFAERGRMGRLLGAIAQNPKNIGLGIDEDTAVVVTAERTLRVIGSGAVYVVDGSSVSYSNVADAALETTVSIHGVTLHLLGNGDRFDLTERRPLLPQ